MFKAFMIMLIEMLNISNSEFTKLLIKAPFSFLFFAKNAIYSEISPYKYKMHVMISDSRSKNQHSL